MSVTDLLWKNSTTKRLAVILFSCFAWFFSMLKSPCVSVWHWDFSLSVDYIEGRSNSELSLRVYLYMLLFLEIRTSTKCGSTFQDCILYWSKCLQQIIALFEKCNLQ